MAVRCGQTRQAPASCSDRTPGPLTNEYPAFITVDNNILSRLGVFEKQPAGVALLVTECDTIRHNTIHDCPRAGICICDGCFGGHVIEYNWVYHSVLETSDQGPFNAWGRDRNGRWGNDTTATTLDAWKTTVLQNNRFEVKPYFFGIDLDDQASNYLQYNNLLIGGGLKLQGTRNNTYVNNILKNAMVEIHDVWHDSHHRVARNVFECNSIYSFCCFTGQMSEPQSATLPDTVRSHVACIDSNCLWSYGQTPNLTNFDNRGASVCTWDQWKAGGLDDHSVVADPMFTDTTKTWPNYNPMGDFSVKSGSPALAMGFRNFPMDSFGAMPAPATSTRPFERQGGTLSTEPGSYLLYKNGALAAAANGDFVLTITSALGRTMRIFFGKGHAIFAVRDKVLASGIYFAEIKTRTARQISRFIIE